ncbi:MAG: polysaccharide deacetylase family protein, partial [Rhodospirillales bacterium]
PENPLILSDNPPAIGFTITKPIKRLKSLACYTSHAGRANVIQLGANRIEVRINKPFPTGRSRLNCTLPTDTGRWYWFGWQYYVPKKPR